jgi:HD-like signal output (HDOD) protein
MQPDLEALSREAEGIARSIGIPPRPAILTKLVRETRSDEPDFAKLGGLIGGDVSLAAALLKTVNSPFYGLRSKATSIRQALVLLGLRNVTNLVTGLLLRQAFPVCAGAGMEEFWEYSSGIAQASTCLARHTRGIDGDLAYTFAVFRDCGVPAMMSGFTDYLPPYAVKDAGDGKPMTEVEEEAFGIHHAFMGYYLAKEWLLPDPVCQMVLWHHDFPALREGRAEVPASGARLISLALVADHVYSTHHMGTACHEWSEHGEYALDTLGMDAADLEKLEPELAAALEEKS